ncbi:hypersensitive response-inducing protein [Coniochaeta sp. 2T2.1]|nr:hypersensitive response-inducing protein [Coniochaeta sp. 2T2.1]
MKSFAFVAAALLSAVSAAPLETRQASTEFDITDFYAGCIPHSSQCPLSLTAAVSPTKSVSCRVVALSYQTLPDFPPTACENDNSVSVSLTHVEGGANLVINWGYDAGRNLTGTRFIPDSEIVETNTQSPTGIVETYVGPKDFVITDLQAIAVL